MRAEGIKRTALCLHALCSDDRQWILLRLGNEPRREITDCLVELQRLGIPADPSLVREATTPKEPGAGEAISCETASGWSLLDRVDGLHAQVLIAVLAAEPDALVAMLVGLHPWAWRKKFFDCLAPERRVRIELLQTDLPVAAALSEAIMSALLRRAATLPIGVCSVSPVPNVRRDTTGIGGLVWWDRVRAWLD